MPEPFRCRYVVHGRVQGVGFRIYVLGVGRGLGLDGSVRNLPDGRSVEAVAEGPPEALARFAAALREGPPGSYVSEFEEHADDRGEPFSGFTILP